ncbi:hypothetical protein [Komagataeibacter xylinus]|uniref:hypothetical protein n=1 Tax=Komagataeibacter xylinus TaxID=28448 RepID=UPI001330AB61|nr:hypothetical protein [Komagataeibacter xylinus]
MGAAFFQKGGVLESFLENASPETPSLYGIFSGLPVQAGPDGSPLKNQPGFPYPIQIVT